MSKKFEKSINDFNRQQAKYIQIISGRLGVSIGGKKQVEVDGRNSFVWVRLRETQNELIQAFNEKVSPVYDLPVIVKRRGNTYYIEGRDTELYGDWGDFSSYLPRHGNQHSFNPENGGGGDITFIFPNQMMPALASPSGTDGGRNLLVYGYPLMQNNGNWKMIGITGTPDIVQHKPTGNTAIMALVYIDQDSGNPRLIVGSGTHFAGTITGSAAVLPFVPHLTNVNTQIPLTAVRLVSGTTSLGWNNVYDLRQWIHTVPSGTGGGAGTGTAAPIASGTYVPGILTPNRVVVTNPAGVVNVDDHFYWDEDNNVAIIGGLSVPVPGTNSMHVIGSGSGPTIAGWSVESGTSATAGMTFFGGFRARGSLSAPTGIFKDTGMVRLIGRGHDGSAWSNTQGQVLIVADENWDSTHHGTGVGIYATPTGTTTQREVAHFYGSGNLNLPNTGTYNVNGVPHNHAELMGTYTPTLATGTNCSTVALNQAFLYMRIGNMVMVAGSVQIDPVAAGNCECYATLPIASNFTTSYDLNGNGTSPGTNPLSVAADSTNDRIWFIHTAADGTNRFWRFVLMYRIM